MRYLLGIVLGITINLTATDCRAEPPLSWASDEGSLSLVHGQDIVWRFNFGSQLSKPFFHPLNLPGGQPSGGYAGLSVRLAKSASEFKVTASEQPLKVQIAKEQINKEQPERLRFRAHAVDYSGSLDGTDGGITISDDPNNVNAPTPWYVIRNTKLPMTFFSPTVIQLSPMTFSRGDSFCLHYQIVVHTGDSPVW